jgi:hypothetical protein
MPLQALAAIAGRAPGFAASLSAQHDDPTRQKLADTLSE